jgi:nicotinamide riboside kinase
MSQIKKIAIIGPESTGKSTLCKQLAAHYGTAWVPEYAREYLSMHGTSYTYGSLLEIAKGQVNLEDKTLEALTAHLFNPELPSGLAPSGSTPSDTVSLGSGAFGSAPLGLAPFDFAPLDFARGAANLFIDTEMYVMKVWSEFVFGKCHQWIIDQIVERRYDLYLLCNIDLPWEPDPLREYPDPEPRRQLFHIYKDILINQHVPWHIISGNYEQRLQSGIAAVEGM